MASALAYGVAWIAAELLIRSGNPAPGRESFHLAPLRQAAAIFPLNVHIREQSAYALMRLSDFLPPGVVIVEIDRALANDPWAWDLQYNRAVLASRIKGAEPWAAR